MTFALGKIPAFWESVLRLENNTYINTVCPGMGYFQVKNINQSTWVENIIVENEENTKIFVHRRYYDDINLLKPKYVDEFTSYRYYTDENITSKYFPYNLFIVLLKCIKNCSININY